MNILFISTLYPLPGNGQVSPTTALRDFLDDWNVTDQVQVFRPALAIKHASHDPTQDGVLIPGTRIPLVELYFVNTSDLISRLRVSPDIIVAHMYKSYLWAWRLAHQLDVPFVAGIHNSDVRLLGFPYLRQRLRHALSRTDGIACRSPAIQEKLLALYPEFAPRSFCATSGIAADRVQPLSSFHEKIARWHGTRRIRLAVAARLQKGKNIDITLRALALLPDELKWTFRVIGDGPEKGRLVALAKRLKISAHVSFLGWLPRDQVLVELCASDLFVLVSAPETFGLVYLEALASGNLVIAGKGWGVDGFLKHGIDGFLCDSRKVDDLLTIIRYITLVASKAELLQIAANARDLICRNTRKSASESYLAHLRVIADAYA